MEDENIPPDQLPLPEQPRQPEATPPPQGVAPPAGQELLYPAVMSAICSGVLSGVPLLNAGCCLWMAGGGILAVYFFELKHGRPLVRLGDGARLGLITGFFGFFVAFFVNLFSQILIYRGFAKLLDKYREQMAATPIGSDPQAKDFLVWAMTPMGMAVLFLMGTVFFFFIFVTLSTAGGAIGVKALGAGAREKRSE
jgi:hypothetical protein